MGTLILKMEITLITKTVLEIFLTKPIVIYREAIRTPAGPVEGKSPNKHNKIDIEVEPLEPEVMDLIKAGKVTQYTGKAEIAKTFRGPCWGPGKGPGGRSIDRALKLLNDHA